MSQIAYKETRGSYIGKSYDTLAYHNYTIDYPKDNSVTFLLIMNLPQIIYKEFISLYFLSILLVNVSQESCVDTEI